MWLSCLAVIHLPLYQVLPWAMARLAARLMALLDPTVFSVGTVAAAWVGLHCMPTRATMNSQSGRGGLGPLPFRLVWVFV